MSDPQLRLFDTEPAAWEEDDQAEHLVATVVFPTGPGQQFDYRVPDRLREEIELGRRVRAPFGRANRVVVGYCVALENRRITGRRLKDLREIVDPRSLLSPSMLGLTRWMADHYLCDWGQVLETVLPAGVRAQAGTRSAKFLSLAPDAPIRLGQLNLPEKQARVVELLGAAGVPVLESDLMQSAQCTQGPIAALQKKGLIVAESRRIRQRREPEAAVPRREALKLNTDQQVALDAILEALNSRHHRTVLIHGVTGSGKTEVYIHAIEEVVRFGRQAIVLVPEISLTPQTVRRFRSRFDDVAVMHSHLTDADRHAHWHRIASGRVQVVVGARSAIFAPVPNLGLIVMDEEHESSFKQETAPRYHARDVAIRRATAEGIPLVLGSATPSLESWHRAMRGEYRLVEMPRRVLGRPMPAVGTIDLRIQTGGKAFRGAIGRQLEAAMRDTLGDGGQVILLLNRRGYSTHIQCPACGTVVRCPDCDIALTHHRTDDVALCHYCDFRMPPPNQCPQCSFAGIRYGGLGTERLEAEVKRRFPEYPCERMDSDAMRRRGSHEKVLGAFKAGDVRILLGTQMIAKGLDFPNVTLVGVVNADTALHLPDFRAAERTFQLITQVAGRTGRGEKGGRVLVQTFNPDHPAIRAAAEHDYAAFAQRELPVREALAYPPFASIVRLVVRGASETAARDFAVKLADRLRGAMEEEGVAGRLLGPAPAPLAKLRGKYRFQIQVHGPDGDKLRTAVRGACGDRRAPEGVQFIVDVDPLDML